MFGKNKKSTVVRYYEPIPQVVIPVYNDILKSAHTLIAGTTGSGKSVTLNGILFEFMKNYGVNNKLILIDPKKVELKQYKELPHCLWYVDTAENAVFALCKVVDMMNARFEEMQRKNLKMYDGNDIYIVIDELADLMIEKSTKKDFSVLLQKILQLGRASKIHVIACTQAPNRKIIPAEIVLNFTNRVALRCLSNVESRQILNVAGAEKIQGYGKALYLSPQNGIIPIDIPMIDEKITMDLIKKWCIDMKV